MNKPKWTVSFFSRETEGGVEDTFTASTLTRHINAYTSVSMVEEVVRQISARYEEHYQDIVADLIRQAILNATSIQVARSIGGRL